MILIIKISASQNGQKKKKACKFYFFKTFGSCFGHAAGINMPC
jgi:hypothetical protein|tara:strand:- start:412 stop:540 length:129 start_codon:yes stop_codon:yes gene_type:complete